MYRRLLEGSDSKFRFARRQENDTCTEEGPSLIVPILPNESDSQKPPSPQPNTSGLSIAPKLWALILMTGVGAGLGSGLLMKLLRLSQHISFAYHEGDFLSGVEGVSGERRVVVLLLAGLLAGTILFGLRRVAGKSVDLGPAIWLKSGELDPVSTVVHAVLSILIVGMGVVLGRESALKEAGALSGGRLSAWFHVTPEQRKLLVACGAGAGMAAAYNVPLGGALFTVEVLLGTMAISTMLPALAASFAATAVSWLLLPNQPTYRVPSLSVTAPLIGWALIAGPFIGWVSTWYVRFIIWADKHKPKGWQIFALPILIFAGIGIVSMWFPELLGNGKNVVRLAFDNQMAIGLICWLLILHPLATGLCLRAGAPGGLFTPTMTVGALAGAFLGQGWSHLFPGGDKRTYAIVGSGALLAAATQGPISSIVFVLELTYHADALMVPLLIAVVGATVVSRHLEPKSI